jgi:ribosomal protein S18 acetylase RimI-like enzyme
MQHIPHAFGRSQYRCRRKDQRTVSEKSSLQPPVMTAPAVDDTVIVPMTAEMVWKAARVHLEALAGSRTACMGKAYVRAFIDWFRQPEHGGIALVAIDSDSDVFGYVIGAPLGYPRALSQHLVWIAACAVIVRPQLFFKQQFRNGVLDRLRLFLGGSVSRGAEPELPAPTMSLVAIGVLPESQGKKIGLRLLQAFETKARELQVRSLRLSTSPDNLAACRFYERCGWRPFSASDERTYYFRILEGHCESK